MRDRLASLISEAEGLVNNDLPTVEQIADYLIEHGVIVPPCKVGQTVYGVHWSYTIDECRVSSLTQKSDKSWKIRITCGISRRVFEITTDKIGKIVFLTREEAEKALAERSAE